MSLKHHREKRWSVGRRLVLLCTLALTGCGYQLVHRGRINQSQVRTVKEGIQRSRQLKFKKDVSVLLESPAEAEKIQSIELSQKISDEEFRNEGAAGTLIGLYPPGIDLKAANLKLLHDQVAAFYDGEEKTMVLLSGGTNAGFWYSLAQFISQRDAVGQMVLAHELTHALQDQHFDLEKTLDKLKQDDDRTLALSAVAEGDATLAGFDYAFGGLDPATTDKLVSELSDLPGEFVKETPDIPPGVSEPVVFEYSAGVKFVAQALRRGGWAAVNALYAKLPQSTRQIMHPELYFEHFTPPMEVGFGCFDKPFDGWRKVEDDTLGEFLLQVLLKLHLGQESEATLLADYWRGDHMALLRKRSAEAVAWLVVMESAYAAERFSAAYQEISAKLPGGLSLRRIERRANSVVIVAGETVPGNERMADCIWRSAKIHTPAPIQPRLAPTDSPSNFKQQARFLPPGRAVPLSPNLSAFGP
jgi:hypothetical protein